MESDSGTDRIQVFVRVRPSEDGQCCFSVNSGRQIMFSGQNQRMFEFDHVADQDTTQESVFARVGKQIVESCVEGYNGTIFAYGQTGSGKTYTMLGPGESQFIDATLKGLIPRSLDYLFELMNHKISSHGKNFEYGCRASFLEIYNEHIYDLLDHASTRSINLRECQTRGVYAEGIIERNVSNSWEAWNVLADGWRNRRVSQTAMNRESSRSHAVFTLTVETKEHTDTGGITKVRQSVLNLVDLAGSERQKDTQTVGLQLREAGKINRSLSVLGQVIMALNEVGHGKTRFVPYRESKLTFLLRDSLGGNTKTFVIVNVHPNTQYLSETVSSLYFAQRAKQIRNRAKVNENTEGNVIELQNELKRLKRILARYEDEDDSNVVMENTKDELLCADSSTDASNYREKFIWAMAMLEQRENTISIHETQIEKLNRYNLARNFVLKLRNAAIAKLEKGKAPTDNEEIISLTKEIEKLKEQILHHPDKAKYQAEISLLQSEVKSYRNISEKVSKSRVNELKNLYKNLLQQNDSLSPYFFGSSSANLTSQSMEADKTMLDNLKQTLKEHQQEIETLKESNEQLQSELKLSKSQVDELNKIIDNDRCQANTQLNKFIDMHNATLDKVIGTPTRKRASLVLLDDSLSKRGKMENVPCAKLLDLSIPDSLNTPMEDNAKPAPSILDQSIPGIPGKEMEDALREELRQMSEELKRYQQMCFDKDAELKTKQTNALDLNEKLTNLNKISEKLKKNLSEISEDFQKEKKLRTDAESEINKLKDHLRSVKDKSFQCDENLQLLQESFNSIEAKYFGKVSENNSLMKEIENKNEKIQSVTEHYESINLELGVVKDRLATLSASYESEKQQNKDLITELEATKVALSKEKRNYDTIVEELEGEAKQVAQEITAVRKANGNLMEQNKNLQSQINHLNTLVEQKTANLSEMVGNMDQLQNTVQSLQVKIQEHEVSYASLEADRNNLQKDFDELLIKFHSAADELDKCKEEHDSLQNKLTIAEQDFQTKSEKHNFELECIQEDLIDVTESASKFEVQLFAKTNDLKAALERSEELLHEIDMLKTKNEEVTNQFEEASKRFEQMDEKMKQEMKVEIIQMEKKYEQKLEDAKAIFKDEMSAELELVTAQLAETKKEVERKCDDVARLERAEMEKENIYHGLKTAVSENKDKLSEAMQLKELAEREVSRVKKKNEELMNEVASLAGHHNHQQKIRYLVKVKEKLQIAESDKAKLDKLCQKLITRVKKHDPDFDMKKNMPEFSDVVPL